MEKNIITTRLRLKDKNTRHLKKMVREVNLIWNHINELTPQTFDSCRNR